MDAIIQAVQTIAIITIMVLGIGVCIYFLISSETETLQSDFQIVLGTVWASLIIHTLWLAFGFSAAHVFFGSVVWAIAWMLWKVPHMLRRSRKITRREECADKTELENLAFPFLSIGVELSFIVSVMLTVYFQSLWPGLAQGLIAGMYCTSKVVDILWTIRETLRKTADA